MGRSRRHVGLPCDDRFWYKDAVIYEVHVRAFADSNEDGIGDFRGLASKLDYLRDLGVTAIWVLPFYPSPLRDDGYDISDYTGVHPDYGILADFRYFLREAHKRGLRVVTELVLNHTSDQHPWFQRARRSPPGSPERDFYVWSDSPDRYKGARVIFKDFESSNWTWDPLASVYYWHRFYHHQPDLNYENPEVRTAILQVMDFWLSMGVDGFRLDAVPYLFERESTDCENLPETHEALKNIRLYVDNHYPCRMLLAEANQWPEDAVTYLGNNDECHMAFHFPIMPRMFMALRMEDRYPILDILEQTPAIPDACQWAIFLRNHDELTLEMVTDEERDYMYRVYAHDPRARINLGIRRRLAPLLANHRRRIELMNGLLFSLPGTPVIYYGDEIGMGDNIFLGDRNGVRTPMQWSADRNAGFSRANSQRLYLPIITDPDFHYEAVNVEVQLNNPSSLLWWMRRLIALRKRFRAFGRGTLELLHPENRKVLAYLRRFEDEIVLVVANLSRYSQYVELDLSKLKGMQPVEMFGQSRFPAVGDLPYLLTLGPHSFYWFALEPVGVQEVLEPVGVQEARAVPAAEQGALQIRGEWNAVFSGKSRETLERRLPSYLKAQRWFGSKTRRISSVEIADTIPFGQPALSAAMVLAKVSFSEGDPEIYLIPITFTQGEKARELQQAYPQEVLALLTTSSGDGVLTGALLDKAVCRVLLDAIRRRRQFKGRSGVVAGAPSRTFRKVHGSLSVSPEPSLLKAEQNNTSVAYGDRAILKLFRRLDEGTNPDLEIGIFLTEKVRFPSVPEVLGALEYHRQGGEPMTLAVLQGFVPNEGDAWGYTLDILSRYFERVASRPLALPPPELPVGPPLDLAAEPIPKAARELIGVYLESARLLGQRTGELHMALASAPEIPDFRPEPFTALQQRSIYQSIRNQSEKAYELLKKNLTALPRDAREKGREVLARRQEVLSRFQLVLGKEISAWRTRIHGDFHLKQVISTGKDFVFIDFEGQPAYPFSTRRIKRSPFRDVAGMLRSFHHAAREALNSYVSAGGVHDEHLPLLRTYADLWIRWVSTTFLRAYLHSEAGRALVPQEGAELAALLQVCLFEELIQELSFALNGRFERILLPLEGILAIDHNK